MLYFTIFIADTNVGTTIYRLRASDADENYPLEFRIFGKLKNLVISFFD